MSVRLRLALSLACILLASALGLQTAHASGGDCNQFETIQSIILSEGAGQPAQAKLELARVAVSYGPCEHPPGLWTGRDIADRLLANDPRSCIVNWHCRAYNLLATIDPDVREGAAVAAHVALTEAHVWRWHVDRFDSAAYWWSACQVEPFVIGELKFC